MDPLKAAEHAKDFTGEQWMIVVLLLILAFCIGILKFTYDQMLKIKDEQLKKNDKYYNDSIDDLHDKVSVMDKEIALIKQRCLIEHDKKIK